MEFVFVAIKLCSLNMLVHTHYADFSKHYGRRLCCEWHPLQHGGF